MTCWTPRGRGTTIIPVSLRVLVLTVLIAAAWSNGCGPSPERLSCLDHCEQQNDTCLLNAQTPAGIQSCGLGTNQCLASCPAR